MYGTFSPLVKFNLGRIWEDCEMIRTVVILGLLLLTVCTPQAQNPYEGQTLVSPMNSNNAHLIEMDGTITQTWHASARPASMAYLLSDGSILRPCTDTGGAFSGGGTGGRIQRIDSDDTIVWDYSFSTADYQQHHDIQPMSNGNVLIIAWESKTALEASDAGRQAISSAMWPTLIAEVEPVGASGGNIVWQWHLWDHLIQDVDPSKANYGVVGDHPELLDINYGSVGNPQSEGDWIHANAIDYNETLDQIVFSSRSFNEIYVIDHSTTTAEAAAHSGGNSDMGGDILYRWGNPQVYDRGSSSDQYFYVVHGVNWIDEGLPGAGNILAFNNGDRPGSSNDYSTVAEIVPPLNEDGTYAIESADPFTPAAPIWTYGGPGDFYGEPTQCGAYRLPNGNTVVCVFQGGYMFEVTVAGDWVWDYYSTIGQIARAERYWETDQGVSDDPAQTDSMFVESSQPNPFSPSTTIRFRLPEEADVDLAIFDIKGRLVKNLANQVMAGGDHAIVWEGDDQSGRSVAAGSYFYRLHIDEEVITGRIIRVD
jgi:Arylsulfotransferase (ASST)/FlgD Ig-like domain